MNVLVLGSGGREHALCKKISTSPLLDTLYAIPGNPGIAQVATCVNIDANDEHELTLFVKEQNISLIIPGSEAYLTKGVANWFKHTNVFVFGPTKEAAQIESSKEFAKELMKTNKIPTGNYATFKSSVEAISYLEGIDGPYVLKYNGLAAGKGVLVTDSLDEAKNFLNETLEQKSFGNESVIIEEFLAGDEFSFMCFVHHDQVVPMPICQDHKRLLENEQGPNTGGMGMISPVLSIKSDTVLKSYLFIMEKTAKAMVKNNTPFTGFLYGGLIQTDDGPKVIEFNARFGDPEAEVLNELLTSDLLEIIVQLKENKIPKPLWSDEAICGVTLASSGYPLAYEKGVEIKGIDDSVYHMGTTLKDNKLVTNGGRVLFVIGKGSSPLEAIYNVYEKINNISFDNMVYRTDIGQKSLRGDAWKK